jgi:hypothetical protein
VGRTTIASRTLRVAGVARMTKMLPGWRLLAAVEVRLGRLAALSDVESLNASVSVAVRGVGSGDPGGISRAQPHATPYRFYARALHVEPHTQLRDGIRVIRGGGELRDPIGSAWRRHGAPCTFRRKQERKAT